MSRQVKAISLVLALLLCLGLMTSCRGNLNGRYESVVAGTGVSYEFKGNKVTIEVYEIGSLVATIRSTYRIEGNKITIDPGKSDAGNTEQYTRTFDFREEGDRITVGRIVAVKKS